MANRDLSSTFTLYTSYYSSCGLMVQLAYAFRGSPRPDYPGMNLQPIYMGLSPDKPDQLSEFYLCKVNPMGKVPVLINDAVLTKPMPESVDITWYLSAWYPQLLPEQHEETIKDLIGELHSIDFSALTFGGESKFPTLVQQIVDERLQRSDISEDYRRALEYKHKLLSQWQDALTPKDVEEAKNRTRKFCAQILALKEKSKSEYIFGPDPTALDAHTLIFIRRLHDSKHDDPVPEPLRDWAEQFSKGEVFRSVVPSGSTLPPLA